MIWFQIWKNNQLKPSKDKHLWTGWNGILKYSVPAFWQAKGKHKYLSFILRLIHFINKNTKLSKAMIAWDHKLLLQEIKFHYNFLLNCVKIQNSRSLLLFCVVALWGVWSWKWDILVTFSCQNGKSTIFAKTQTCQCHMLIYVLVKKGKQSL